MAVSLALNWTLPVSSPLFDNGSSLNTAGPAPSSSSQSDVSQNTPSKRCEPNITSLPLVDSSKSMQSYPRHSSSHSEMASSPPASASLQSNGASRQHYGSSPHQQHESPFSAAKSYASVASAGRATPAYPAVPMPSYRGVGLGNQQAHIAAFHAQRPIGTAWSPLGQTHSSAYHSATVPSSQSVDANQISSVSEDGRRLRSPSNPAARPHLTYNDTLQHYPGAQQPLTSRPIPPFDLGLAKGNSSAVAPSNPVAPSQSTGANGGSFHPYRRAQRTEGTNMMSTSPSGGVSQGPPIIPMPSHLESLGMPTFPERARTLSDASNTTTKGTATSAEKPAEDKKDGPTPIAEGSATISMLRPSQSTPHLATYAAPLSNASMEATQSVSDRPSYSTVSSPRSSVDHVQSAAQVSRPSAPFTHMRNDSMTSSVDSSDFSHSSDATSTTTTAKSGFSPVARKPVRSPLAHANKAGEESTETAYTGSDDENTIGGRTTPTPGENQKKSLSGKLRKALSLSTLQQVEAAAAAPDRAYGGRANVSMRKGEVPTHPHSSGDTNGSSGSTRSTSPPHTPDNGVPLAGSSAASITSRRSTRPPLSNADGGTSKRSLFRAKFNASTDNISISSTVSSASMMLRKVGNLGKLARRSNLKGITNIFKDKADGREGLHDDDFGTLPVASDEVANASSGKKDKSKSKKGSLASAAVSHATVELDNSRNGAESMTPAASYVRHHQLQMKKQAEEERIAREKAEAERVAAAAARSKTKSTDDVTESRQKMIEKEKERLKSKRGWRKRLGVGSLGSSSETQQVTGLETVPLGDSSENATQEIAGGYPTPRGHSQMSPAGQKNTFNEMSYDSAFGDEDFEPPHMPAAEGYESGGDEFETDSLRHWGEGIERSRESAARIKQVKGILKNTDKVSERAATPQSKDSAAIDKSQSTRFRSNSYDAPQAGNTSASVPPISHITSAATDRVDGVPRANEGDEGHGEMETRSITSPNSASNQMGHHPNASMPTLSMIMHPSPTGQRSVTAPAARKRLVFADNHIYHSTWPAHVYDRRGELATCNRLTPLLAQRIKEELNTYKMEEMAVAPSSRIHTHFFV